MNLPQRVLIANRGEIAIRIASAAAALGIESVCIYAAADQQSLHRQLATRSVLLGGDSGDPVASYLDIEQIVSIAREQRCDCIHPGYGFLSENPQFARACAAADISFIGPAADVLELFGNKLKALALAQTLGIPVAGAGDSAPHSYAQAIQQAQQIGYPVMLKAAAGGGGRGMRAVAAESDLAAAFDRCQSEALAAFGDATVFIEKLIQRPRHIEVQVLGDSNGNVVHLHERDCSVQLRNQKLLEIAPAPNLDAPIRQRLCDDALRLSGKVNYCNAGTVEFLIEPESGQHYFIECNPRIQVEHTVTEQITGLDLVEMQFQIAAGASLTDLGIGTQLAVGEARGYALQARLVAQGSGTLTAYKEPSGAGIRVDACGYLGYTPAPEFDPLLAKLIVSAGSALGYGTAVKRLQRALREFHIAGLATNIQQLQAIVAHPQVLAGDARTSLLAENPQLGKYSSQSQESAALAYLQRQATLTGASQVLSDGAVIPDTTTESVQSLPLAAGQKGVECPMAGSLIESSIEIGQHVLRGEQLLVISAMKMESQVLAPCRGEVIAMLPLAAGSSVASSQIVAVIQPDENETTPTVSDADSDGWQQTLQDVETLRDLAKARLAPGSDDPGVLRQRNRGKLTCRERIDLLLDDNSFRETGSIAGFVSYDDIGQIEAFTPANSVGGHGTIEGRPVIVCADDFTSRGGHADGAIAAKSVHLDRLSIEMRTPSIRLLDGSSGGGSVATMVPRQKSSNESAAKESDGAIAAGQPRVSGGGGSFLPGHLGSSIYAKQLSTVPVVNMLLGSVVGLGAAKAVLGHFSVMVRDLSQLFVAGPPVVKHAMGYDITKEDLGGWHIHCRNGSIDNLAESEEEAVQMTRQFLSYLPSSVYHCASVLPSRSDDPVDRREEELRSIIPRKRTSTFDMRKIIRLLADRESFFEIGPYWGTDQITGFVRFNGHTLGVIASDSQHKNGGALTADGCDKLKRHLDLCDLFHIPLLNLVDNPGFAVGLEHEIAGTIRRGGEWMIAFAQTSVPIFTVIVRRSFGVAGNNYATPRAEPSMRVVWPAADAGGIPPEGGIEAAYKRQLAEATDPVALRAEIEARIESARGPVGPLNLFQMEEMIDPRDTRQYVCNWVLQAYRVVSEPARLTSRALQFRP